ncbi:precorrin-6y C5,15-methyltransferase (decarboxylating) subunit CbiE [Oricola thermophila]|uniref:Precorrin-6y C5,15-methyltransferase (Decarboxylating) subunit CbiE n=1 Tax=Oricola thermophila TaxID=2742145 RepID=A0A6N1VDV9_9HYPH|nr:precorrin-6y C5,15-methyltransferase (decarboxylating) subunit CbiE [Oricola thermophila]QKV17402.1 precorrin-6y C5,15-methyltransferase (decarboxylating) subunit CbiE [Oricola thermophila]
MTEPWLHIIGIGEDGMAGLSAEARRLVEEAEVIVGGDRHHNLAPNVTAERIAWPSPFDAMIGEIRRQKGRRVVVLVTGDPLWYSVGAKILKGIPREEIVFHPQLSAFQFASCRMGWSLADVETLTVHGRAAEQIVPWFAPGVRMLLLTKDATSPATVAKLLVDRGYGPSKLTVLAALGGPQEARFEGVAESWDQAVPDFHVLAVECVAGPNAQLLPRTGLPDDAFVHDGKITKRTARALALAKLVPVRDGVLWDIGCGCGSVAIEWMRAGREALAIGIEPQEKRRALAEENALRLGTPKLKLVDGTAPEALGGLPEPDAVFIGGGISRVTIGACIDALKPHGRLVAHAVTLESEAVLLDMYAEHGGELQRISVETAEPVGPFKGWKPSMPVTQWAWVKKS